MSRVMVWANVDWASVWVFMFNFLFEFCVWNPIYRLFVLCLGFCTFIIIISDGKKKVSIVSVITSIDHVEVSYKRLFVTLQLTANENQLAKTINFYRLRNQNEINIVKVNKKK